MAGLGIADEDTLTVVFIFAGLIVYLFGLAYTHVCLNLTYQALKPAPREENLVA
jgi:hypothetical protein